MRFDDRLRTVLHHVPDTAAGRVAQWRQLLDLVVQGATLDGETATRIEMLRGSVPAEIRARTVAALTGQQVSAALVELVANDRLAIAAPLLTTVRLTDEEWLALVPRLPPAARMLLRERRDLGAPVSRALAGFTRGDMIVEGPAGAISAEPLEATAPKPVVSDPEPDAGAQIRNLLERIESFRRDRPAPLADAPLAPPDGFAFETDAAGTLIWIEGIGREALIGLAIAAPADTGEGGVDGQAAGAFRRRAPFRSARLLVPGHGEAGGDWRISGVPFFDPAGGRFLGYRGSARRPRRDETAAQGGRADAMFAGSLSPDSLRQLIHELRTPLNAIQGFADMIDGQLLGPAPDGYRRRAGEIARQARRLLGAVEDLDLAARISGDEARSDGGSTDGAALLCRLHAEHLSLARENDVDLRFTLAKGLAELDLDLATAERMMSRLIAAAVGLARRGETVAIGYDRDLGGGLRLTVSRPEVLGGLRPAALLDPGYSPDGEWPAAPTLGLGFALRLVANLARANRGRLLIEPSQFALLLPAHGAAGVSDRQSG